MQKNKYQGLDDIVDDFEDEKPLHITDKNKNSTNSVPDIDPKIQQEYEKFLKEMNYQGEQNQNIDQFTNLMGNLLSNLSKDFGPQLGKNQQQDPTKNQQFKSKMEQMMKNLEGQNFQEVANKLLNQFMDKQILSEPLIQAKKQYELAFKKSDIKQVDLARFKNQYLVIVQLIEILQKNPNDKELLIKKFQKLQQYGSPPEGIQTGFGL